MAGPAYLQPVKYLFVDGGYLREAYGRFARAWFTDEADKNNRELIFQQVAAGMRKTFYYDCKDDSKRRSETDEAFRERQQKQEEQFNKIQSVIGCHVQLGTLAGEGTRRRQKEVDILLTVDMMNHAIRQNMSHAYLLAGDRDFRPVVKSLVDMGIHVIVKADIRDSAPDLIRAADGFEEIKFSHYYGWTPEPIRVKYPVPETTAGTRPPELPLVRKGYAGRTVVLIYENGDRFRCYFPDLQTLRDCNDIDRLLTYLQLEYGEFVDDDSV